MPIRPAALALAAGTILAVASAARAAEPATLVIERSETAGIDGRRWDETFPGAATVDAVHRSVLLRFPGAAEAIAAKLAEGMAVERAELVLKYAGHEESPPGYTLRVGMGLPKWKASPPRWHVVAWALRRPWASDPERGPTFNAFVKGAGHWALYGASDPDRDRFGMSLGAAELSSAAPEGRIDVTPVLVEKAFGPDAGSRLRAVEEKGFLIKKLETYDVRYRDHWDAYEWAVPTGGHGLSFREPRLVLTFKRGRGGAGRVELPPRTDVAVLAARPSADGSGGEPTAVMPMSEELKALAARIAFRKPARMSDWEFERVSELRRIGGSEVAGWMATLESGDVAAYRRLVDDILSTPPRYWKGWGIQNDLLLWYCYGDALPGCVRDHVRAYWESWLMRDVPTKEFYHPQSKDNAGYWKKTEDWRGRTSFFRDGYCYAVSTMNFNHTASMGALLGGDIIGADRAKADGRRCLEQLLLRFWSYLDGTSQEMLDHYYFSITLSCQKMFADFGPTELDRLMGRMILDRAMELLASGYHPDLRRIISASGRARLSGVLVEQDGIYGALHTLSRKGVLMHADIGARGKVHGMPAFGYDFPPDRVALQALRGPFAGPWMTEIIDSKPIPYEITATETTRGNFKPPLWRRAYLGRHYGLASQDIKGGTVDVMAQWKRTPGPANSMEDLGTLTLRYSVNEPNVTKTGGGAMPYSGGIVTFQDRNRAIVCTKPRTEKERTIQIAGDGGVRSLSTTVALWNFREDPGWEIYVDDARLTELPARARAKQVITIRDGVSYVGLIPLPATDLGRRDEVVIAKGEPGPMGDLGGNITIRPALMISSYNMQRDAPLAADAPEWETVTRAAFGGFVIEMGDEAEHGDFDAFRRHMRSVRLVERWDGGAKVLHLAYKSGKDLMEMGFCTDYAQSEVHFAVMPGQHTKAIPYRKVNGKPPYLPDGIDRDTTLTQQGTTGRLEKNGATLVTEPGHKAYLVTEPVGGTYVGYNPFPDPVRWAMTVPGGIAVTADGKLGMARVAVSAKEGLVRIDHAFAPGQEGAPGVARHVLLSGFRKKPEVELNGSRLEKVGRAGAAYAVPLAGPSR